MTVVYNSLPLFAILQWVRVPWFKQNAARQSSQPIGKIFSPDQWVSLFKEDDLYFWPTVSVVTPTSLLSPRVRASNLGTGTGNRVIGFLEPQNRGIQANRNHPNPRIALFLQINVHIYFHFYLHIPLYSLAICVSCSCINVILSLLFPLLLQCYKKYTSLTEQSLPPRFQNNRLYQIVFKKK